MEARPLLADANDDHAPAEAGAEEQGTGVDVGGLFHDHGHDRGHDRVGAPCLPNDRVRVRPQEGSPSEEDPVEGP